MASPVRGPRLAFCQRGQVDVESDEDQFRIVSKLKKGDQVSFWPDCYTELLNIRAEQGQIYLLTLNPITGLPTETEYQPEDLVMVKQKQQS